MQKGCVNRQIACLPITITKFPFRFMKKMKKTCLIFAVALIDVDPRQEPPLSRHHMDNQVSFPTISSSTGLMSEFVCGLSKPSNRAKTFFHFHFFLQGTAGLFRQSVDPGAVDHHFVTSHYVTAAATQVWFMSLF